jgi:hypothetical protein
MINLSCPYQLSTPFIKANFDKSTDAGYTYACYQSQTSHTLTALEFSKLAMMAFVPLTIPTSAGPIDNAPTKGGWTICRQFLLSISNDTHYLLQPIGDWLEISNWHHHGEWFTSSADRSLIHKVGNQCFSQSLQGRGISQFSLHPTLLLHAPNLHSKALVKRHRASLE